MERITNPFVLSFTIWIMAALFNAIGVEMLLFVMGKVNVDIIESLGIILLLSLLFSLPGIFLFWIIFISNYNSPRLYQKLLFSALLISSLNSAIVQYFFSGSIQVTSWLIVSVTVVATFFSLAMHHRSISKISKGQ